MFHPRTGIPVSYMLSYTFESGFNILVLKLLEDSAFG